MHRSQGPVFAEYLEGRRLFSCSGFGQEVAVQAADDDRGQAPTLEVVGENPSAGVIFGEAVSERASACEPAA